MDLGFIVRDFFCSLNRKLTNFGKDFFNTAITLYKAEGISETLKYDGIHFSAPYIAYLLNNMKKKTIIPEKEAEHAAILIEYLKKYGELD